LTEQAIALDPNRAELEELRANIAQAKQEEYRRTHFFRVTHKHGSGSVLGGMISFGDGKTRGCTGTLELLDDGFRFKTEQSQDSRRDDVEFRRSQVKKVELKDQGQRVHIETTSGNFDFYAGSSDLQQIYNALTR